MATPDLNPGRGLIHPHQADDELRPRNLLGMRLNCPNRWKQARTPLLDK